MALEKCKECGAEISSSAPSCPKCGAVPVRTSGWLVKGFIFFIIFLVFVAVVGKRDKSGVKPQEPSTNEKAMADNLKVMKEIGKRVREGKEGSENQDQTSKERK